MKQILTLFFYSILVLPVTGQSRLTLEDCYSLAESNYPLVHQRVLTERQGDVSIEKLSKGNLPALSAGAQASYQSDVTQIPVEMRGVSPLSKDQYRVFAEASQKLYDGGLMAHQRNAISVGATTEKMKIEVDLYQLRARVDGLFFGILLAREQVAQSILIKTDLGASLRRTQAAVDNGTALRSAADALRSELLKVDQRIIELESNESLYRETLAQLIGIDIAPETEFVRPSFDDGVLTITRPELRVFEWQDRAINAEEQVLSATYRPRVEIFLQGGYGRPGLNMLENDFSFYYLAGVRASWNLSRYYSMRNERELLDIRRQSVDVQKEVFLFQTELARRQHRSEMERLHRLIAIDEEIIALQTDILRTAEVQLEQGVISSSEYIRQVNSADQARQRRALHEVQRLRAQAEYHFLSGQPND